VFAILFYIKIGKLEMKTRTNKGMLDQPSCLAGLQIGWKLFQLYDKILN